MKKPAIIAIIIVLLGVLGIGYLFVSKDNDDTVTNIPVADSAQAISSANTTATSTSGSYQEYSEAALASTTGTKILFFHANWCPQCRALEADIKQTQIPSNVTVFKVDYDNSQTLKQKYGVTLQTTLVKVDDSGNLISKYVAYNDPSWEAVSKNLL